MDSLQKISNDLVNSITEKEKKKSIPYDTYAKVIRIDGGTAWVHIPGGVDETPVALTVNAKVGDSVLVRVSGGNAWIVGNSSAPPTDDTKAVEAKGVADVAQVKAASAQETAESAEEIAKDASRAVKSTSQYFWHTETDTGAGAGAHITEVPQEDFLDDPANGGGNLLARSNGIAVRDGLAELAVFGAKGMEVYGQYGSVAFIGLSDTQALAYIPTDTGIPAVGVTAEIDFGEAIDWALGEVKVEVVAYIDPLTVYKKSVSFTAYGRKTIAINRIACSWNVQLVNGSNGAEVYITTTQLGMSLTAMSYIRAYHWGTANAPIFYTGTPAEAGGAYSATLGLLCSAEGYGAHATNMGTKATSDFQTALGKYNIEDANDEYAVIVGNGSSNSNRSNALTVDWSGNVETDGDITDGSGNVLDDKLDVSGVLNIFYPVGSYYETSDTSFDPNTAWGGTWVLETEGQVHVSAGTGYPVAGAPTDTSDGGSADAIVPYHRHSVSAVTDAITGGAHTHDINYRTVYGGSSNYTALYKGGTSTSTDAAQSATHKHNLPAHNTNYAGSSGNATGANMPPYIAVNRWHRTA